ELGTAEAGSADAEADRALVGLADAALAAVGPETRDVDAQRPACGASRTARAEQRMPEPPPALQQPRHVLGRRQLADQFVLQPPGLVGQIAARSWRGHVPQGGGHVPIVERRFWGGGDKPPGQLWILRAKISRLTASFSGWK